MFPFIEAYDSTLAILTVLGGFIIFVSLIIILSRSQSRLPTWITRHGLWWAFIVALIATSGSLFYSDVIGYLPCKLCWYQRIFMYPQVIILALAAWKHHVQLVWYGTVLSSIVAVLAAYHYALQLYPELPSVTCGVVGYSVSCTELFVLKLGYITIPMMALTAFVLMILFLQGYRHYV